MLQLTGEDDRPVAAKTQPTNDKVLCKHNKPVCKRQVYHVVCRSDVLSTRLEPLGGLFCLLTIRT